MTMIGKNYLIAFALACLFVQTSCSTTPSSQIQPASTWQSWPKQDELSARLNEIIKKRSIPDGAR